MFEISKEISFDMGHRLSKHNGKCFNLHGHTYIVEVTLKGDTLTDVGYLIDFTDIKTDLKEITDILDHKTMLYKNDSINERIFNAVPNDCLMVDFEPTAENIAKYIFEQMELKHSIISSVKIWETPTSYAIYKR